MANYQSFLRFAQRMYHRLPVPDAMKWRLRGAVQPVIAAMRGGEQSVTEALKDVLMRRRNSSIDGPREARLERAMLDLAAQRAHAITHIIVLPFLGTGGAEMVAMNFARAAVLINPANKVLVVVADRGDVDERVAVPAGATMIILDQYVDAPSYDQKRLLLLDLVASIRPKIFHNINSDVAWQLIIQQGKKLNALTSVCASIFALQFSPNSTKKIGYAAYYLKPGLPWVTRLLTDNRRFVEDARTGFEIGEGARKIACLYNPSRVAVDDWQVKAMNRIEASRARRSKRPAFLWAGRLDSEKRVDICIELVRRCPEVDFFVYGQVVVEATVVLPQADNLKLMGPFSSPSELVAERDYAGFVFTSRWEGMPNILLELGALGVPIIAPAVGGVPELIGDETGYLVQAQPSVDGYIRAITEIIAKPDEAARRAEKLVSLIAERHTWDAFVGSVRQLNGYAD